MKKYLALLLVLIPSMLWAMSSPDVSVNILHQGKMLKEISGEVWMPFNEEYQIRLQNYTTVRAVAKVVIDGIEVSKFGELVIPANGKIDLERFIDHSLTDGKRFKFVPVSHPEVQDKGSSDNGKIVVEIRKEKQAKPVEIVPESYFGTDRFRYGDGIVYYSPMTGSLTTMSNTSINCSGTLTSAPSSSLGATIGGSESQQKFTQVQMDLEDQVVTLELRLRGY